MTLTIATIVIVGDAGRQNDVGQEVSLMLHHITYHNESGEEDTYNEILGNDFAVVVLNRDTTALSLIRDNIKQYALRCDADYIETQELINLPVYNKILFINCDVIIKEDAPNIFLATADDSTYTLHDKYIDNYYITPIAVIPKSRMASDLIRIKDNEYIISGETSALDYRFNCQHSSTQFWRHILDCYFIIVNGIVDADYRRHMIVQFLAGDYTLSRYDRYKSYRHNIKIVIESTEKKNTYDQTNIFTKNRIGIFYNNLSPGGATTWLESFTKCYYNDITGIIALEDHPNYNNINCGLVRGFSLDEMYELYTKSDIILYWIYMIPGSMQQIPDFILNNRDNKKIIFLSQSSHRIATHDYLIKLLKPDAMVCVDEYLATIHNAYYIPPVVKDFGIIRDRPAAKHALWHHRLERYKGITILAEIISAMPDYTFHVAGSWMPELHSQDIISLVEDKIIAPHIDNVYYHGHLDDMSELLRYCSISISTSLEESFGLSIAESILNGLPTVSHHTGVGRYADAIVPFDSYYGDWVMAIRSCEQSNRSSKHQGLFKDNFNIRNYKALWDKVLCKLI